MKKFIAILVAVLLLAILAMPAAAHDVPQDRNDCSATITISYDGKAVNGGTLTAIRVGYIGEDDGNYFFLREYDNELLSDPSAAALPQQLLNFYNANKGKHTFKTKTVNVTNGSAVFKDLPTGLYLMVQNTPAKGFGKLAPFLVGLPYLDEQGVYQYHLNAAAKPALEREPETTAPPPTYGPWLPQTGQLNWPVPVMAVLGTALFVAGWVLCFLGRRKCDGED